MLCEYGCGKEANYQFKNGKWCCSKSKNSCKTLRRKNSISNTGYKHHFYGKSRPEMIGDKNPMRRPEISIKFSGENNPMYGKTLSKKTKQKISESKKGNPSHNKGKILSEETRTKISLNHANVSLENNPNWKGGISCEPYCEQWLDKEYKESIKERDGYICLNPLCNYITHILDIHHINYNKKDCNPNNLITLCRSCNVKANFDREWHVEWYKRILNRRYNCE